jgi:hypothetical protein
VNDILGIKRRLDAGVPLNELAEDESFFTTLMRNEKSLAKYELQADAQGRAQASQETLTLRCHASFIRVNNL